MSERLKSENKRLQALLKNIAEGPMQIAIRYPWNDTEEIAAALVARRDNALAAAAGQKFSEEVPPVADIGVAIHIDAERLSNTLCERFYGLMDDGIARNDCADACDEAIQVLEIKRQLGRRHRVIVMMVDYSAWEKP